MSINQCPKCDSRFRGDIATCPVDGTELVAPDDPFVGTVIAGRYLVEELLGAGGMGSVYRARHQFIGRDVALKFLDQSFTKNERLRKRFLGEARAANQINHEHIIDITDFGETEDGIVYLVMEYLEGHSLEDAIEEGPLEPRRALRIALQVALGLGRAHELGVVHRDIKPANIYLTRRRSDRDFVKVLDFGVARIEQDARITGRNMIVGTPEYIAPEQIRSSASSPSSDLYSLGCVLFEMLTGKLPFDGKTTELLIKHINDEPPVPSSVNPNLPPEIDRLVLRLLQKTIENRHRDAYHLVDDLQRVLDGLPGDMRSSKPSQIPRRPQPPTHVSPQPEETGWENTALLYRKLLSEVHPKDGFPAWLPAAVGNLEAIVEEIRGVRRRLEKTAADASAQQEELRRPRRQIGHALDELAKDDSRLGGQINALMEQLAPNEARLDAAMHIVLNAVNGAPRTLRVGDVLSEQDGDALRELVRECAELALTRDLISGLRTRLSRHLAERRDLRFQIVQLKQKLDHAHQTSTVDMELWHEEAGKLSTELQTKLSAMAPIAERISEYFGSYPELQHRLTKNRNRLVLS